MTTKIILLFCNLFCSLVGHIGTEIPLTPEEKSGEKISLLKEFKEARKHFLHLCLQITIMFSFSLRFLGPDTRKLSPGALYNLKLPQMECKKIGSNATMLL
jgi:hypothetical protein